MPQFTIIVPLMDQVSEFETTLASVLRYAPPHAEVLVAQDGSYTDPYGILSEVRSVIVSTQPVPGDLGRVALASAQANSPWVFWLAPGIEMTEATDDGLLEILKQRDLGLISPRIVASDVPDPKLADRGDPQPTKLASLASSVALTPRFHPAYLEDLLGEQWEVTDVHVRHQVCGPTAWAGICRRQVLEQWSESPEVALPDGYAELSLGLLSQGLGWEHDWMDGVLIASPWVTETIERGYQLCGRASNQMLENQVHGSAWSRVRAGLAIGLVELATGVLNPRQFRVAGQRLGNLSRFLFGGHQEPAASGQTSTSADPSSKREGGKRGPKEHSSAADTVTETGRTQQIAIDAKRHRSAA